MFSFKRGLLAGLCLLALSGTAMAADLPPQYEQAGPMGWYLRIDAGASWLTWSGGADDDTATFGGGVGFRYSPLIRFDVRVDHAGDYKTGGGSELDATSVTGNLYWDIALGMPITPYVGGGLGVGWVDFSPGTDRTGLAAQAMAGFTYDLTPNVALDVGYRFRDIFISGADVTDHAVTAGARFTF